MSEGAPALVAEIVEDHGRGAADADVAARWHARWLDWLTVFFRGRPGSVADRSLTIAFVALGAGVVITRSVLDSMRQIRRRFA
jgi:hypothetical protein